MTPTKKTKEIKAKVAKASAPNETKTVTPTTAAKTTASAAATKTEVSQVAPAKDISKRKLKQQQKKPHIPHKASTDRKKRAKLQQKIKQKKHPLFRGRFGKPNVRRKSIKKWQKWRKWRGIDIRKSVHHGFRPDSGYRTAQSIRGMHPGGFFETTVFSLGQLESISSQTAIRIASNVGKKNRKQILAKASQKGIRVLN